MQKESVVAKKGRSKPSVLKKAASLRAVYRKWLFWFLGVLALCLVIFAIYFALVSTGTYQNYTMLPWFLALVAAGGIGILGNKFSKAHREYEAFLEDHDMHNSDVVEFLKSN